MADDFLLRVMQQRNESLVAEIAPRCRGARKKAVKVYVDEIMLYAARVNVELEKMRAGLHQALDLPAPKPYVTTCAENTFDLLRDLYVLQADLIRLSATGRLEDEQEDDRTLN